MHLHRICLYISNFGLRNGISRIRIRELASEEISQLLIDRLISNTILPISAVLNVNTVE